MNILLTGATGFVGSAFLAHLLCSEHEADIQAYVLVRGEAQTAQEKLELALARALNAAGRNDITVQHLLPRIHILLGDATLPLFGIAHDELASLRAVGIQEIWASAATLTPQGAEKNVVAAQELVHFSKHLAIPRVFYLSTAYITGYGDPEPALDAALQSVNEFNNDYERSKSLAEHHLVQALADSGSRLSILRPSIIVGYQRTRLPSGSTSGFYAAVYLLRQEALRNAKMARHQAVRLCYGDGELNLVSIDKVLDEMMAARKRMASRTDIQTDCRFISGSYVPLDRIMGALKQYCNLHVERLEPNSDMSSTTRRLHENLSYFLPYTFAGNRKRFQDSASRHAEQLHGAELVNLAEASHVEISHKPLMNLVRATHLPRPGKTPLIAYHSRYSDPGRPTVILLNAYGMPVNALHPLISRLTAQGVNVATWDYRSHGNGRNDPRRRIGVSFQDQHEDWTRLRTALELEHCVLLGWSTGATLASYIAAREPERITGLCLLNGHFMHPDALLSQHQKNMRALLPRAALSAFVASLMVRTASQDYGDSMLMQRLTRTLAGRHPAPIPEPQVRHHHLVHALASDPRVFHRYARLMRAFMAENPMQWLDAVRAPTLLMTGAKDTSAHPQGSRDAAARIPDSRLLVDPEADHFSLYYSPSFIRTAVEFITSPQCHRRDDTNPVPMGHGATLEMAG